MPDRAFLTYPIPGPGIETIRAADIDVDVFEGEPIAGTEWPAAPIADELVAGATGAAGLLTLVRDAVSADILDRLPGLKVVANFGVGYDNIDVAAATARGIVVTNTPDVLTNATADLTWALILAITRRVGEGERLVRSGGFVGWDPRMLLGRDLAGATLGLLGFGRIARAVARRAAGFDMRVIHHSRHDDPVAAAEVGSLAVDFDRLLVESDILSVHVPLSAETRHMLGEEQLRRLKPTAYIVNTARGPVIDEKALVTALRERRLGGAGLDVYEREPELAQGLAELDNAVLLPHLGSATAGTRAQMGFVAATNLVEVLSGRRPPNPVNPEVLDGA